MQFCVETAISSTFFFFPLFIYLHLTVFYLYSATSNHKILNITVHYYIVNERKLTIMIMMTINIILFIIIHQKLSKTSIEEINSQKIHININIMIY